MDIEHVHVTYDLAKSKCKMRYLERQVTFFLQHQNQPWQPWFAPFQQDKGTYCSKFLQSE